MRKNRAFTLVELIIVIAIIAILSVVAFLYIKNWITKSRDTARLSDINIIDNALQLYLADNKKLLLPENNIQITANGNIIGYQGIFGDSTKDDIGNIDKTPRDPLDDSYYTYYVDKNLGEYQILGFAESQIGYYKNSANAIDYSQKYFLTKGGNLGIITDISQSPVNLILTGFDVATGIVDTTGYIAVFDNNNKMTGTGKVLQWLRSNINNGGPGYSPPSSCPDGFVPVPGNKDFNQPGFCVAKYEMKQKFGDAGSRNGIGGTSSWGGSALTGTTVNPYCNSTAPCRNTGDGIDSDIKGVESKPEGYPIVRINQYNSIKACESMGRGYHLITNNERMTVARNIETTKSNWGYDKFMERNGDNTIYYGINKGNGSGTTWDGTSGALPATFGEYGASASVLQTGRFMFKRTHDLSNGQIIRDFSLNVREFVNGANTIDGSSYDSMNGNICGNTASGRYTFGNYASTCNFTGGYTYNTVGPINKVIDANGMGYIYSSSSTTNDKVFLRGGGHRQNTRLHGIYVLFPGGSNITVGRHIGFRCAR